MSFRKHTAKDGRVIYFWRGKVPVKGADGKVEYRLVERSTKAGTLAGAREAARRIEAEYHERSGAPLAEIVEHSFADAALLYMQSGGERRYLAPIILEIGKRSLLEINQTLVQAMADKLKPNASAATLNRHIFTPVLAVLNYAARAKMAPPPSLIRPKDHDKAPALNLPDEAWFDKVMPLLSTKTRACLLLITLHGLRISEACERVPADLDTKRWLLTIPDTKTGEPVRLPLSEPVIEAIGEIFAEQAAEDEKRRRKGKVPIEPKWLFGTGSRHNIAGDIREACDRAGVRRFGTHAAGRHSFATRVLDDGKSVKFLMAAVDGKQPRCRWPATATWSDLK